MKTDIRLAIFSIAFPVALLTSAATIAHAQEESPSKTYYVVTSLGTLGGQASIANSVNNKDWVAGQSNLTVTAVKPTSAAPAGKSSETTNEGAPEPPPSCSQGTDVQFGADHSPSEAATFVGHCARNGTLGHLLTGQCTGHYLSQPICLSIQDAQQCPPGAQAIKPSFVGCGSEHFLPVDVARSCSH